MPGQKRQPKRGRRDRRGQMRGLRTRATWLWLEHTPVNTCRSLRAQSERSESPSRAVAAVVTRGNGYSESERTLTVEQAADKS
jgi:hypothetical protein